MRVQQSALVRDDTTISSVADLDQPGRTIGINTDDSVGVWLRTRLRHARLLETPDYSLKQAATWLLDGTIDAFAGNRQRLAFNTKHIPNLHILPDNLYGVSQTVAIAPNRADVLKTLIRLWTRRGAPGFWLARSPEAVSTASQSRRPPTRLWPQPI